MDTSLPRTRCFCTSAIQAGPALNRKSTRLNSSHLGISYAVFCLKKNNALKVVGVHPAPFNLELLLRKLSGWGKPRQPQGRLNPLQVLLFAVFALYDVCRAVCRWFGRFPSQPFPEATAWHRPTWFLKRSFSATAC